MPQTLVRFRVGRMTQVRMGADSPAIRRMMLLRLHCAASLLPSLSQPPLLPLPAPALVKAEQNKSFRQPLALLDLPMLVGMPLLVQHLHRSQPRATSVPH